MTSVSPGSSSSDTITAFPGLAIRWNSLITEGQGADHQPAPAAVTEATPGPGPQGGSHGPVGEPSDTTGHPQIRRISTTVRRLFPRRRPKK